MLKVQDNKALLVSVYTLDFRPYHDKNTSINWENSSLRKWLNSNFLTTAFSKEEQKMIPVSTISNKEDVDCYGTVSSKERDTKDQIFILNVAEIVAYLHNNYGSNTTDYVEGLIPADKKTYFSSGKYWARSTSALSQNRNDSSAYGKKYYATTFSNYDTKNDPGGNFPDYSCPVRPALWLDLQKGSDFVMKEILENEIK